MPAAGDLRNRVRFEKRGLDANGDALGAWEEHCTVWTHVKWLRGSEAAIAGRLEGRQPVALVIRASTQAREITTGFRAVAVSGRDTTPGAKLNIKAVSASPDAGFLDVLAELGGATG